MISTKIEVPAGIVVTTELYNLLLEDVGLNKDRLYQLLKQDKLGTIRKK